MILPIIHAADQFFQGLIQQIAINGVVSLVANPFGCFKTRPEVCNDSFVFGFLDEIL